jgi:hypothetical protein
VIRQSPTVQDVEDDALDTRSVATWTRKTAHAYLPDDPSSRLAAPAFAAVLGVALVLFLVFGHSQWFFLDDWDYLADRGVGDVLRPHNEHWSTLPILAYRTLWRVFGLRTYVPYQFLAILLHLTAAALLRRVMRRAGVGPWIATAAASLFALFGFGYQNILFAFQMAWGASLVLGLTHLLLADHDGPIERRDWLGLLAGLAGVLCSGLAVTMTVVVGLAALIRRGWRAALFHTVPLGLLYVVWWLAFARSEYSTANYSIDLVVRFVAAGFSAAFGEIGQLPGAGLALGVMLLAGLVLAWRGLQRAQLRKRAAAPAALLIGAVLFLAIAGVGRASLFGPSVARSSRYLHIVAALSLPAIAVAAQGFMRRSRALGVVAVALLVVGLPGNIDFLVHYDTRVKNGLGSPDLMLALPRVPLAREAPRNLRPAPDLAPYVTIGWLRDGVSAGRIPSPDRVAPITSATANLRLSLFQSKRPTTAARCRVLRSPVTRSLAAGQSIIFNGGRIRVSLAQNPFIQVSYGIWYGRTLVAVRGPLNVRLESDRPSVRLTELCE